MIVCFFSPVGEEDVLSIIRSIPMKFSAGPDGLNSYIMKQIAHSIVKPLTSIINKSLCTGIMLDSLKVARVVPIYKKDDPEIMNNYRPVSILPPLSKVFEKIVPNQLNKFASRTHLFFSGQYGFRPGCSTTHAVAELHAHLLNSLDKKTNCYRGLSGSVQSV